MINFGRYWGLPSPVHWGVTSLDHWGLTSSNHWGWPSFFYSCTYRDMKLFDPEPKAIDQSKSKKRNMHTAVRNLIIWSVERDQSNSLPSDSVWVNEKTSWPHWGDPGGDVFLGRVPHKIKGVGRVAWQGVAAPLAAQFCCIRTVLKKSVTWHKNIDWSKTAKQWTGSMHTLACTPHLE